MLTPPDRALAGGLSALVLASALIRAVPPEPNWWAPAALIVVVAFARTGGDLSLRARRAILAGVLVPTLVAAAHVARPFLPLPERADPDGPPPRVEPRPRARRGRRRRRLRPRRGALRVPR